VRWGVLGPLLVEDDTGNDVRVPAGRLRTLLAVLLMRANQPVPLDELVDLLWDGAPPGDAIRTVRVYVARLRQVLGPHVGTRVLTLSRGYLCRVDEHEFDLLHFERLCGEARSALGERSWSQATDLLTEALRLWRGGALVDVPSELLRARECPRLEQLRSQAAEDHIDAQLNLHRYEQLVPQLRILIREEPLREHRHAQLVRALAHAGRRAEALESYRHARRILADELGIEPGPELSELHQRILTGRTGATAVPESAAVPRQLPAAARYFTGRRDELEQISGLLQASRSTDMPAGTVVISAIDGMGGIGKTALAVHAAYALAERFPDGQLFIDLYGYTKDQRPREPGEALSSLLRTLGVAAQQIPQPLDERAALYRQRLADTRTLVVLDNALDEAQVRPLLPAAPTCLVLVTSRRRLKGLHDAHVLALDVLPEADALTLLRTQISPARADDGLTEIVDLCGRLPLALRIAGALLRHRPAWTPEYLAGMLRDEHRRLAALADGDHDLRTVLDLSYAGLDERHRRLFRRLALIPGPDLDAFAAAALLDTDPAAAAGLLEDLVDHSLLIEYAPGRYRLHDLIRVHAVTLADDDPQTDRDTALDRLLHYYAYTAQSASVLVSRYPRTAPDGLAPAHAPALTDPRTGQAWLRAERENLEAAHAHASGSALDGHAVALAAGLAEILRTDGPFTRALEIHQAAAGTAERHGWTAAHAGALNELGSVRRLTGNLTGAADAAVRALEIQRASGNREGEAVALNELGNVRSLTGDYPGAADAHTRALEIWRTGGHRHGEATTLTELGHVRLLTGDYTEAADAAARGLEIFRAIGHPHGEAASLIALGRVRLVTGDLSNAGDSLAQALEIYRTIGDRHGEANALVLLANVRRLIGELTGAADAATRALRIYRTIGHRHGQASALADLARVQQVTGDLPEAGDALAEALEIYRAIGHRHGQGNALVELANVRRLTGELTGAADAASKALQIYGGIGHPDGQASALVELGRVQQATGDPRAAGESLAQALGIFRTTGNRNAEAWALNFYAAAIAAAGELARAHALYEQALTMNRELNKPDDEAVAREGLGESLLSLGESGPGTAQLRQALEIYERLGMTPDTDRVRNRLADLTTAGTGA
jgi:DNA-binding SARP family transcriptional activator